MQRKFTSFGSVDIDKFKRRLLHFGSKFSNFCFLENNNYHFDKSVDCLSGIGSLHAIRSEDKNGLEELISFQKEKNDWIFGHAGYDLKNKIENLSSANYDGIEMPDYFFFVPEIVVNISGNTISIGTTGTQNREEIFSQINASSSGNQKHRKPALKSRFSRDEYLNNVLNLQKHIAKGDCYEVCFCQEYYAFPAHIDPVKTFLELNKLSPNPFAAYYKLEGQYLICASPERFLKKSGEEIISQPIKGTLRRTAAGTESDVLEAGKLLADTKERAENTMIVDLVRNDLSKVCRPGSVVVRDFLKIHSLPGVHQMISTIVGKVPGDITFGEMLAATFPMGSMTGAPKIKAMELIEKYEKSRRGLFSGTVGYIDPGGNFDFNVVIRSLLYNMQTQYLSAQVGSAITIKSVAEKEYEECQSKIAAIFKSLDQEQSAWEGGDL